jgi:hypothetical protein
MYTNHIKREIADDDHSALFICHAPKADILSLGVHILAEREETGQGHRGGVDER